VKNIDSTIFERTSLYFRIHSRSSFAVSSEGVSIRSESCTGIADTTISFIIVVLPICLGARIIFLGRIVEVSDPDVPAVFPGVTVEEPNSTSILAAIDVESGLDCPKRVGVLIKTSSAESN
jgi:hypothetical protein